MAIGVVEAIYKFKYFIFCGLKAPKNQGKWQEHRENIN